MKINSFINFIISLALSLNLIIATNSPSIKPSTKPSTNPTTQPSSQPSSQPSFQPTSVPSNEIQNVAFNISDYDLFSATKSGSISIVEAMIKSYGIAEIGPSGSNIGFQSLIYAISAGHQGVVETLIQKANISLNQQSIDGYSPIMFASKFNCLPCVKYLCTLKYLDLSLTNKDGDDAIAIAMKKGNRDIVNYLRYNC